MAETEWLDTDAGPVQLKWYEMGDEVDAWTEDGQRIGHIAWNEEEGAARDYVHRIVHAYLDGPAGSGAYRKCGIGRRILEIMRAMGLKPIFTRPDGLRRPDASHLTGDGPIFAAAIVKRELAHWG